MDIDEDVETNLRALNVQVRDEYGDWRDVNDILDDLISIIVENGFRFLK